MGTRAAVWTTLLSLVGCVACGAAAPPPAPASRRAPGGGSAAESSAALGIREPVQIAGAPVVRDDGTIILLFLSNTNADYLVERTTAGAFRAERLPMTVSLGALFDGDDGDLRLLHYDGAGTTRLSRGPPWSTIAEVAAIGAAPGGAASDARGRVHAVLGGADLAVFDAVWTRRSLGLRCSELHAVVALAPGNGDAHVACWSSASHEWGVHWIGPRAAAEQVARGTELLENASLALVIGPEDVPHVFFTVRRAGRLEMQHAWRRPAGGFDVETLTSHPEGTPCPGPTGLGDRCERTWHRALPLSAHFRGDRLELLFTEIRHHTVFRAVEQGVRERYIDWSGEGVVKADVFVAGVEAAGLRRERLFEGDAAAYVPSARATVDAAGRLHVAAVVGQKPRYAVVE